MDTMQADPNPTATTPDRPQPAGASGPRIASLDFIRGVAVMGILAANIVAFGQPFAAYTYPGAFLTEHDRAADLMWVAQFVLIDGKMRALFTLLFGAGLYLFLEKAWEKGSGIRLQVGRLLWLGLFGAAHFVFLWKGDILLLYASCGLVALLFVRMEPPNQLILGLIGYIIGALIYLGAAWSMEAANSGTFLPAGEQASDLQQSMLDTKQRNLDDSLADAAPIIAGDYPAFVSSNLEGLGQGLLSWLETLPLMLVGMALYRMGFFEGAFARRKLIFWGLVGIIGGGLVQLWIAWRALEDGLTYYGTLAAFTGWALFPRLAMSLGLLALLTVIGSRGPGWLHGRIAAAGRAAFTNYLGTSILMLFVFHGWALGLFGKLTRGELYLVVLATWAIMLLWSKPWLDRFRYGPFEWLWRCLTYGRIFALRR